MTPPADDESPVDDGTPADEADDPPSDDPPDSDASPDDSPADTTPTGESAGDDAPVSDSREDVRSSDAPTADALSGDSPAETTPATSEQGRPAAPADEQPSQSLDIEEYTTDHRSLSASVQLIWALRALVGVAIISAVAAFLLQRFDVPFSYVGIGALGLAIVALVWVHLRHRIWTYRVREDALFLERGVVTRVNTVVPYVRIQHVDTQRGPLERAFGLSTLVVYTAGSRGADVSIPGLTTHEATDLQQRVKDLAIETEGGDAL